MRSGLIVDFEQRRASLLCSEPPREFEGKSYERIEAAAGPLLKALAPSLPSGARIRVLRWPAGDGPIELELAPGAKLTRQTLAAPAWEALPAVWRNAPRAVAEREAGLGGASEIVGESLFWDERYAANDTGWDLGAAAPPLVRAFGTLPPQRAIVVGCGRGYEVAELARRGFEVVGIDFAPRAVADASERVRAAGLSAQLLERDLFDLPGSLAPFSLWVEHTCFCAIDPARRAEYVDVAARTLAPGGLLLGLFYAHGRPGGPPFTTDRDEIERLFGRAFVVEELTLAPDSHPRRRGEELLGRLRRR